MLWPKTIQGKEEFIWLTSYSPLSREVKARTQKQELEAVTNHGGTLPNDLFLTAGTMEEHCPMTSHCFSKLHFLHNPSPAAQDVPPSVGQALLHQSSIQKTPHHILRWRHFSLSFPFPRCVKLTSTVKFCMCECCDCGLEIAHTFIHMGSIKTNFWAFPIASQDCWVFRKLPCGELKIFLPGPNSECAAKLICMPLLFTGDRHGYQDWVYNTKVKK